MARYAAFLRGINVGGKRPVAMNDLREALESAGFRDVRTVLQSGDVLFDAAGPATSLGARIERVLRSDLGVEADVFVRSIARIARMIREDPFREANAARGAKRYVTFLPDRRAPRIALPLVSRGKGVEVFAVRDLAAFSLCRPVKGRSEFPNAVIEEALGIRATTRNWNTVRKLAPPR